MLARSSRWSLVWTLFVVVLVIGFALGVGWWQLQPRTTSVNESAGQQPVAMVNGVVITQDMIERELMVSRFNVADPLPSLQGVDLERATDEALNQMITRQIILQAASREDFTLADDFIAQRVNLLFGSYGDNVLTEALNQAQLSQSDLSWWVKEIFTVEEFTTQVIMAQASPTERQQVYNEWLNTQQGQTQVNVFEAGQAQTRPVLGAGQTAPNFTLSTVEGRQISLSDYAGKVVLVNFWATWCPSCVSEMPDYEQIYQQYNPEFVVLGVNLQEGSDHVAQYANGLGLTFPVLLDSDSRVTTYGYQVTGMPGSFIINRDGTIYYRHVGPMTVETLTTKLAELGL